MVEVFWYGCPHCYSFEPFLENWLKTLPADVQLVRVPGVLSQNWIPLGKAFYTAEKLGVLDKVHRPLFDAIHKDRKVSQVPDEESLKEFFVSKGVAADQFSQTFASKEVEAKIRQAYFLARDYKLTGVPSLVINGKYLTSASNTGTYENMINVLNQLVENERGTEAIRIDDGGFETGQAYGLAVDDDLRDAERPQPVDHLEGKLRPFGHRVTHDGLNHRRRIHFVRLGRQRAAQKARRGYRQGKLANLTFAHGPLLQS